MSKNQNTNGQQKSSKGGCKKHMSGNRKSDVAKAGKRSRNRGENQGKNHVTTTEFLVRQGMGKTVNMMPVVQQHTIPQELIKVMHIETEIARKVNASWLNS